MSNAYEDAKTLRKGEYWHGTYKGIGWKIQRWERKVEPGYGLKDEVWNYYVYLPLDKINQTDAKKLWITARANNYSHGRKHYNYPGNTAMQDLELQGGITWYRKLYGLQDEKIVEVGCDYDHIWNERDYSLYEVLDDAYKTVDSVLERFPELEATGPASEHQTPKGDS